MYLVVFVKSLNALAGYIFQVHKCTQMKQNIQKPKKRQNKEATIKIKVTQQTQLKRITFVHVTKINKSHTQQCYYKVGHVDQTIFPILALVLINIVYFSKISICETSVSSHIFCPCQANVRMCYILQLPSNGCTYQDKVFCSLTLSRRCTSSWWTFRSTFLKIGPLLGLAEQSFTLNTCHTQQRTSFSLFF